MPRRERERGSQRGREPSAREVFEVLVRENADRTMVYIRSITRGAAEAEDVFQESMLVAFRRLNDFDRSRPFGPWVRGIASRVAMARARRAAQMPVIDPSLLDAVSSQMTQWDAAERMDFESVLDTLRACMDALTQDQQACVQLAYRQDMPLRDVAAAVGANEETIKKRLQRARASLAECLRQHGALA